MWLIHRCGHEVLNTARLHWEFILFQHFLWLLSFHTLFRQDGDFACISLVYGFLSDLVGASLFGRLPFLDGALLQDLIQSRAHIFKLKVGAISWIRISLLRGVRNDCNAVTQTSLQHLLFVKLI